MKIFKSVSIAVLFAVVSFQAHADDMKAAAGKGIINRSLFHSLFPVNEKDEAMLAHDSGQFSDADYQKLANGSSEDFFKEMDNGVTLPQNQDALQRSLNPFIPGISKEDAARRMARGRNNWMVWTGGNDRFWTFLGGATFGGLDFLKTLSSEPSLPTVRGNRWETLGLVNEPCFKQATGPRADRWGLWLDTRSSDCAPDPFEDASKYPGVKIGARGTTLMWKGQKKTLEVGSSYGYPTGIVGFRLFPNPDFDQKAANNWDPVRYYNDPVYYNNPNTIRPYRVGMACALCHVGPNPSHPPADFNNPKWADLSSNPGAQYFWVDRIFMWNWKKNTDSFVYQLLHTSRPGSLDTSLVSSDQINNPRTMNAVYNLPARITAAMRFNANEQLSGDEVRNMQFNKLSPLAVPESSALRNTSRANGTQVISPRVLKDASDSVGALGALNRVYVNIGLFGEEWVKHFIPLVGGPAITPFPIATAEKNSLYWNANVQQTPDLALFFLAAGKPDKLANAPGGAQFLQDLESPKVSVGKKVFAESCARCHSSKLPDKAYSFFNAPNNCQGSGYLSCWNNYWNYTKTPEFKQAMEKMVMQSDFLDNNFLSTDLRVPVNLTDTQLCSPVATNAIKGDIWDNFSSTTYKNLTSVGQHTVNFPLDSSSMMHVMNVPVPAGGRGFIRPPSLISVWSTAPFLQNNSLGLFDYRGTVEGRMRSFNDSINKLLNPETRTQGSSYNDKATRNVSYKTDFGDVLPGQIDVTTQESYLKIPRGYLPDYLFDIIKQAHLADPVGKNEDNTYMHKDYDYPVFDSAKREVASLKPVKGKKSKNKKGKRDVAGLFGWNWGAPSDPSEMANELFIGPIPAGIPVNLIANINLDPGLLDTGKLNNALFALVTSTVYIKNNKMVGDEARDYFMKHAAAALIDISKCQDFVVNRGHYFGTQYAPDNKETHSTGLTQDEKAALIEYLKHF